MFTRHSDVGIIILGRNSKNCLNKKILYPSSNVRIIAPYAGTRTFRIKKDEAGKSILAVLCIRFPFYPKEVWNERINLGRIRSNEIMLTPETVCLQNQEIQHHNPNIIEPSVPDNVHILWRNEDYVAVYKPAPMPVHAGGRYWKNTCHFIAEELCNQQLFVTHRLDAVTLGILIFATSGNAAQKFRMEIENEKAKKSYTALVHGILEGERIVKKGVRRKNGFVFEDSDAADAKIAETRFVAIKSFNNSTLVHCFPKTGRTHQLRVHLRFIGHPIVDDAVYENLNCDPSPNVLQQWAIRLIHHSFSIDSLGIDVKLDVEKYWSDLFDSSFNKEI